MDAHKEAFQWVAVIRLPDFVAREDFNWAVREATKKKKIDCSTAEYLMIDEGLCVQCLHVGSYDDEPATVEAMDTYVREQGYVLDLTRERCHHEIYLSDARKVAPRNSRRLSATPSSRLRIAEGRGTDDAARGSCAGGHGWRSPGDAGNVGPITT